MPLPVPAPFGRRSGGGADADNGRAELVPNEELPAPTPSSGGGGASGSVPVLYYTTSGGRSCEEVAIVTNSVGGQYIVSPSGRPDDLNPKARPVTAERLARLQCMTILALFVAPLAGVFVLLAFLRCRRAFLAASSNGGIGGDGGGRRAEASLWASRTECLFVFAIFCVLAELVLILLGAEYYVRLRNSP